MFNLNDYPEIHNYPGENDNNFYFLGTSAWDQLIPIVPIIVKILSPKVFVELGVHRGTSYFAFCYYVKYFEMKTKCFAIDSWKGDRFAGYYGEDIFYRFLTINNKFYYDFSNALRMSFNDALKKFDDNSISILHIDGSHSYEDVYNDYNQWKNKVEKNGVILFHDVNEYRSGFGVWKFWKEISQNKINAFIPYSHGLGILLMGNKEDYPEEFISFIDALNNDKGVINYLNEIGLIFHHIYYDDHYKFFT